MLTEFAKSVADLVPVRCNGFAPSPSFGLRIRSTTARRPGNIAEHYDLSNKLFAVFLDETMTYSSALFEKLHRQPQARLADAQRRKIDRLLDTARVGPGSRVLEIGTGWGELCIRAAARGARPLGHVVGRTAAPGPTARGGRRLSDRVQSSCATTATWTAATTPCCRWR